MNKEEVIERLKKDLDLPNFKGRLEEKEYTEEEYQKIKNDLNDYLKIMYEISKIKQNES